MLLDLKYVKTHYATGSELSEKRRFRSKIMGGFANRSSVKI